MITPPDTAAREQALDVQQSLIVQAPAGSGKTTLLVERTLRLLAGVDQPEEILAITFTRKAANEMLERITNALALDNPLAEAVRARDASRGWRLLENPQRLQVQTIDAFCLRVLRALPEPDNVGYDDLVEAAEHLYTQAVDQLFEDPLSATAPPLMRVLAYFDNHYQRVHSLITTMLATRDQWLATLTGLVSERSQAPADLDRFLEQSWRAYGHGIATTAVDQVRGTLGANHVALLQQIVNYSLTQRGLAGRHETDDVAFWRAAAELLLTAKGQFRKTVTTKQGFAKGPEKQACLALLDEFAASPLLNDVCRWRELPAQPSFEHDEQLAHDFALVLSLAAVELQRVFAQERVCDFTELTLAAIRALGADTAPTELALALDYQIQHILVDEFQDTSLAQFNLLERLLAGWQPGDGRTFFAVGDPTQSIYRFRNADVALYMRARNEGIASIRPAPVTLTANFRAEPELVEWLNSTFGQVFEPSDNFHAAEAVKPPSSRHGVRCSRHPDEQAQSAALVQRIAELAQAHPDDTFAILLRSRTHIPPIANALDEARIAWLASDIAAFVEEPIVADLLALIRVLAEPYEPLATYTVLRSPMIGLALRDLHRIALAGGPRAVAHAALSDDAVHRYQIFDRACRDWRMRMWEVPARYVVESLWLSLGGANAYPRATLASAERVFAELDQLGHRTFDPEHLERALAGLFVEPTPSNADAKISVMTVHKAKGLEFDHVFLPSLERPVRRDDPPMLLWHASSDAAPERISQLVIAPQSEHGFHRWLRFKERAEERAETKRLLYVACTRAIKSLHLMTGGAVQGGYGSAEGGGLAALLKDVVTFEQAVVLQPPSQPALFETSRVHTRLPDKREPNNSPAMVDLDLVLATSAKPNMQPAARAQPDRLAAGSVAERGTSDSTAIAVGNVVHALLAQITRMRVAETAVEDITNTVLVHPVIGLDAQVRAMLNTLPHEIRQQADVAAIARDVRQHVTATAADPTGRWLLATRTSGSCEQPYAQVIEGRLVRLIPDRSFLDDHGVRWIVDYKTTPVRDTQAAEAAAQDHRQQLASYAQVLGAAHGEPIRTAIFFTARAILVEVDFFEVVDDNPAPVAQEAHENQKSGRVD